MEVIENPRFGAFAIFEGDGFTASEWARVRKDGLGINLLGSPTSPHDLEPLRPGFEWLRYLMVNSSTCDDLRLIAEMPALRNFAVGGIVRQGLDVADLPPLTSFDGPVEKFPGIVTLPSLRALGVGWRSDKAPQITAPLQSLSVTEKAPSSTPPDLLTPELLESLEIVYARSLDLLGLSAFAALEEVTFHRCKIVNNLDELLALPSLRSIVFEECRTLEGYEALAGLRDVRVRVIGRNPFESAFRAQVAEAAISEWIFPPGAPHLSGSQ